MTLSVSRERFIEVAEEDLFRDISESLTIVLKADYLNLTQLAGQLLIVATLIRDTGLYPSGKVDKDQRHYIKMALEDLYSLYPKLLDVSGDEENLAVSHGKDYRKFLYQTQANMPTYFKDMLEETVKFYYSKQHPVSDSES